jgi:hypothetical protein
LSISIPAEDQHITNVFEMTLTLVIFQDRLVIDSFLFIKLVVCFSLSKGNLEMRTRVWEEE